MRKVIEPLPDNKDELETSVIEKFKGALLHFERREIENVKKADPWPDFEAKEGSDTIGIEVVELVNRQHNILHSFQQKYETAILERLGDKISLFNGLHITLNDNYQTPQYPKVKSLKGQQIVEAFVSNLVNCVDELRNLKVGQTFVRNWQNEDNKPKIGIFGRKGVPKNATLLQHIDFFGSFPESEKNVRSLLAKTVQHKIEKLYTPYDKGRLLLLVYEVGSISVEMGGQGLIKRAQEILEQNEHPFDEVWYIFPYAKPKLGALYKVWLK